MDNGMSETLQLAGMLKVLSVETRVRLLKLLAEHPYCVNALADKLELSAGAVSQHLKTLREAGLVEAEKRGYYLHYSLVPEAVAQFRATIEGLLGSVIHQLDQHPSLKGGPKCPRRTSRNARSRRS
jgi:DNA-binding transcriptional ArsR family regulator